MPNKVLTKRPCPICHSKKKNLLHHQNFSEISYGSLLAGYNVVICQQCGFGYADRIPSQAVFDSYYQGMSKYENQESLGQPNQYDWKRFKLIAEQLKPYFSSQNTTILEIGCATGGLLSLFKNAGQASLTGLDPSLVCAQTAYKLHKIQVEVGNLFKYNLQNRFDFLILIGVLEHVRELQKGIAAISNLVEEAGQVYIEVPDALHFAEWPDAPYQQFSTEHINFFSPISLQNLMHQNGFKTLNCMQLVREHNFRSIMPVVAGLFEKQTNFSAPMMFDSKTHIALEQYIQVSKEVDSNLQVVINDLVQEHTPIYVWGVGTHTQRLLAESNLGQAPIIAFIDSNPNYHGKILQSVAIKPPRSVQDQPFTPILISSRVFQNEIENVIRNQYSLPNPLIRLYSV